MRLQKYTVRTFGRELVLLAAAVLFCVPLYLVAAIAFKSSKELTTNPFGLPQQPTLENFSVAWQQAGQSGMASALLSSLIVTIGSVAVVIVVGSLGAFVLARRPGHLSNGMYFLFLLGFILPIQLAILPIYTVFSELGLLGNLIGMIILEAGFMMPLGIILYTGFIRVMPHDFEEAARIDGAGDFRTFRHVVFPLLRPVTGTVAVLGSMFVWNDFFASLIFLSGSDYQTVPVAVYSFVGEFTAQWPTIFAAVLISIVPMLLFYIFAQRQLMRGFSGGVKG